MANDNMSFITYQMELQVSHRVRAKDEKTSNLWTNKSRYRKDIEAIMRSEESRDNRSRGMPGAHSYADEYSTVFECRQM